MPKKDGLVLSKSCAQPVQTQRTGRGSEHNLCAGPCATKQQAVHKPQVVRTFHTFAHSGYPHRILPKSPLLSAHLSTLYTGPIKTITTYI